MIRHMHKGRRTEKILNILTDKVSPITNEQSKATQKRHIKGPKAHQHGSRIPLDKITLVMENNITMQ